MRIWIDDVRTPPRGYVWIKTVDDAVDLIAQCINEGTSIEIIDTDHDAGDFANMGRDYIRVLDWLEMMDISLPIRIHSMNPVGVHNMRMIIQKNGWREVR